MSDLGSRLQAVRKALGYTQKQVANGIGVAEQAYQRYEYGRVVPSAVVLADLADFFDLPSDFLLGRAPFENWAAIMAHKQQLISIIAQTFGFNAELLEHASLQRFIQLFGLLFARVQFHDDSDAIDLYPYISPSDFSEQ